MSSSEQQTDQLEGDQLQIAPQHPLTVHEVEGITIAVRSAFLKLHNLYEEIEPIFAKYGLKAPSAGVIARNLSEEIETAIVQHCSGFEKGKGYSDLDRYGSRWEVKICKKSGLTINQSSTVGGENYIVVNYTDKNEVSKIWVLWDARDEFFSKRRTNSNARSATLSTARGHVQVLLKNGTPSLPFAEQPQARKEIGNSVAKGQSRKRKKSGAEKSSMAADA